MKTRERKTRESPRPEVAGGYEPISAARLATAWWAYREGLITKLGLRAYFGCIELETRRRLSGGRYQPSRDELRKLVGGSEEGPGGLRAAVKNLVAAGLLRACSRSGIVFAESPGELACDDRSGLDAMLAKIQGVNRKVPVPRRMIRRLAGGLGKARTATVLAHLIRCLFYRKGEGVNPVGCCKASWVADVFGVTERSVFDARRFLVLDLGWLQVQECSQHVLNRDGLWVTVDLDWGSEGEGTPAESPATAAVEAQSPPDGFSGPPPENAGRFAGPGTDKKPLRENNNQKPASRPPASGGPAGFSNSHPKSAEKKPDLRDVVPEDLRDAGRLLDLHRQAVDGGFISTSEADRLAFLAAAAHARAVGSKPCRLFAWMVRGRRFEFITQADEDQARSLLRPRREPESRPTPAPLRRPEDALSDDAKLARSVQAALNRAGYRGDPLPLVRRERPEWTRERWDAAVKELRGGGRRKPGFDGVGAVAGRLVELFTPNESGPALSSGPGFSGPKHRSDTN